MGVYIKDTKMPKHCGECGIEWCERWKKLIIAGMSIAKSRPADCPLIEIPPHGRLIDADALKEAFCGNCFADEKPMECSEPCMDMRIILETPTIIPEEEGE